jgi:hypothetical protein
MSASATMATPDRPRPCSKNPVPPTAQPDIPHPKNATPTSAIPLLARTLRIASLTAATANRKTR